MFRTGCEPGFHTLDCVDKDRQDMVLALEVSSEGQMECELAVKQSVQAALLVDAESCRESPEPGGEEPGSLPRHGHLSLGLKG